MQKHKAAGPIAIQATVFGPLADSAAAKRRLS
jgi:hypothetical protein